MPWKINSRAGGLSLAAAASAVYSRRQGAAGLVTLLISCRSGRYASRSGQIPRYTENVAWCDQGSTATALLLFDRRTPC